MDEITSFETKRQQVIADAERLGLPAEAVDAWEESMKPTIDDAGWYYSSVVQWMPEFSTEKINGYTGPFINQTEALEALFIELDEDMEAIKRERDNEATKFSALSSMYDQEIREKKKLQEALRLIEVQLGNMVFNLNQSPDTPMDRVLRALEHIREFAK